MKGKVIKSYQSAYSNPIRLQTGDVVVWIKRESGWDGWLWCKDTSGKEGWVPESILIKNEDKATVTKDYIASELTVAVGDKLEILSEEAGWLWCKNISGDYGWVPKDHVELI